MTFSEFCPDADAAARIEATFRRYASQRQAVAARGSSPIPLPDGLLALLDNPEPRAIYDGAEDALLDWQLMLDAKDEGCVALFRLAIEGLGKVQWEPLPIPGATISRPPIHASYLLASAASRGHGDLFAYLLGREEIDVAHVDAKDSRQFTPLHALVESLLGGEYRAESGVRASEWAQGLGFIDQLIDAGAPLEAKAQKGSTPLTMAIAGHDFSRREELSRKLLAAGANMSANDAVSCAMAAPHLVPLIVEFAPARLSDTKSAKGLTPLHAAVSWHNVNSVEALLAAGADRSVKSRKKYKCREVVFPGKSTVDDYVTLIAAGREADSENFKKIQELFEKSG